MLKNFKKVVVFIAILCLNSTQVLAYDFVDSKNESNVNSKIQEIYDSKQQYEDFAGEYEEVTINDVSSISYWWPIGSMETTEKDGKIFAKGTPVTVQVTSPFGNREVYGDFHNAIDIGNAGYGPGQVNIIAAKDGEVVYPINKEQTSFEDNGYYGNTDGSGYGNYVKIKHSDGTYTVYGHLAQDSITVTVGDVVEQGQVIGKMGQSGSADGTHLHFEVRVGSDTMASSVDPLSGYVSTTDTRPSGNSSNFMLFSTTLSKAEFVAKMNDYCERSKNQNFCNVFSKNAEMIYEVSLENNVNPELVVVTAKAESNFQSPGGKCANNYWGLDTPNGQSCQSTIGSLKEGIAKYASNINLYVPGGKFSNAVQSIYKQREEAGCKAEGHGEAGTVIGMQSYYSYIGDYRYDPGDWGLGGCVYLNIIYGAGYCSSQSTCKDKNSCPASSKTTTCEQNDYTAWQVEQKLKIRYDIFGL